MKIPVTFFSVVLLLVRLERGPGEKAIVASSETPDALVLEKVVGAASVLLLLARGDLRGRLDGGLGGVRESRAQVPSARER